MSSIDEMIAERLRKLRNEQNTTAPKNVITVTVPPKTNVEQVEDLLRQLTEETAIDSNVDAEKCDIDSEIRMRLDKLKCSSSTAGLAPKKVTVKDIVDQYTALAELPDKTSNDLEPAEELPWCVICNEDAAFRCNGCDGDIYCSKCFMEFHDKDDLKTHIREPYNSKNSSSFS